MASIHWNLASAKASIVAMVALIGIAGIGGKNAGVPEAAAHEKVRAALPTNNLLSDHRSRKPHCARSFSEKEGINAELTAVHPRGARGSV